MKSLIKKQEGFTLIEIVLVLAIAALIILMVFLALSGANKARRDTQRKQALSAMVAQLENYASNNNGDVPTGAGQANNKFAATYLLGTDNNYKDPLNGFVYGTNSTSATNIVITGGSNPAAPTSTEAAGVSYKANSAVSGTLCIGLEAGAAFCQTAN